MSCILCQKNDFKIVSSRDSKNNAYLKVVFCKACGMVQQDPIPSENEVNEYYSNEYRQDYKKTYTPKIKHVYRAGSLAIERINFLKDRGISKGNLLDVGAGGGEFTYLSNKLGFLSQGIEPNIGYSNYARQEYGINIQTGRLADIHKKFSLITMFHALEHIPNPIKTFKLLHELLEKDGCLFIEVPNIESKDASPHNIYFKAHIHYFSAETLVSAASKYFYKIDEVKDSNLRILFKKKSTIEDNLFFPSIKQVNHLAYRLQKKGWLEYLFKGRGYKKFPLKIKQYFIESQLNYKSGSEVLNDILKLQVK
jgi:2-polyprenyl-3-methyl-5-hydroxy-6-metoxy-1,4-benzoquinol methylase